MPSDGPVLGQPHPDITARPPRGGADLTDVSAAGEAARSAVRYFGGQSNFTGVGDTELLGSRGIDPWFDPTLADQTCDCPLAGGIEIVPNNPVSVRHQLK